MVHLTFTLNGVQMNIAFTRAIRNGIPTDHQFKECNPQPPGNHRFNFQGSRVQPVAIIVIAVEGQPYGPSPLVIGDHYCVFQSHQRQQIQRGANTGLNNAQVQQAIALYQHMIAID
ncbi:MAG: hypothetical protein NT172_16930 [Planctomycetota bacterium]|nr:hypothetical protein [Planctomycetota bacterium]